MLRSNVISVMVGTLLWACTQWAWAQGDYEPDSMYVNGHRWATVKRMEIHLFGIPVGAGGMSRDERARVIANERLDLLLNCGVLSNPDNIEVGRIGREVVIWVRNPKHFGGFYNPTLILTIDRNFERFLGRSRWDIAYYWRDLMRKWSRAGVMKVSGATDPAGRPLDPKHSWHRAPRGYARRYMGAAGAASASSGGGGTGDVPGGGLGHGPWGVPGE